MEISFKDLVALLDINAPIFFIEKNQLNRENYVFFRPMGGAEKDAFLMGKHDPLSEYDPTGIGLYFPDITTSEYYQLENSRNPIAIEAILEKISQQMSVYTSECPILFSVHCVLHEYGHWIHFKRTGKSPYEYVRLGIEERKQYTKIEQGIYAMDDRNPLKLLSARRYYDEIYSQFPPEKFANEFAAEHFCDAIEKVRAALDYTEQDLLEKALGIN